MQAPACAVVVVLLSWPFVTPARAQTPGEAAKKEQEKKEQEKKARRGNSTQQPKTYTDEDLAKYRASPPPQATSSGASPAPRASGSAASSQPTVAPRSDPAKMPKPDRTTRVHEGSEQPASVPESGEPTEAAGLPPPNAEPEPEAGDESGPGAEQQWRARAEERRSALGLAESRVEGLQYRLDGLRNDTGLDRATDPFRLQKIQAEIVEVTADLERARTELVAARQALENFEEEARRANVPPGWLRERPNGPER